MADAARAVARVTAGVLCACVWGVGKKRERFQSRVCCLCVGSKGTVRAAGLSCADGAGTPKRVEPPGARCPPGRPHKSGRSAATHPPTQLAADEQAPRGAAAGQARGGRRARRREKSRGRSRRIDGKRGLGHPRGAPAAQQPPNCPAQPQPTNALRRCGGGTRCATPKLNANRRLYPEHKKTNDAPVAASESRARRSMTAGAGALREMVVGATTGLAVATQRMVGKGVWAGKKKKRTTAKREEGSKASQTHTHVPFVLFPLFSSSLLPVFFSVSTRHAAAWVVRDTHTRGGGGVAGCGATRRAPTAMGESKTRAPLACTPPACATLAPSPPPPPRRRRTPSRTTVSNG